MQKEKTATKQIPQTKTQQKTKCRHKTPPTNYKQQAKSGGNKAEIEHYKSPKKIQNRGL